MNHGLNPYRNGYTKSSIELLTYKDEFPLDVFRQTAAFSQSAECRQAFCLGQA